MGRDMCLTRVVGKGVARWWGARGKLLITAWDFIKPRLSCAQCIVYYHPGSPSRLCAATHRCSLSLSPPSSPWYYVSRRWSRGRENKLAGLLLRKLNVPPPPLVSNYTAWTPSKLGDSRLCLERRQTAKLYPRSLGLYPDIQIGRGGWLSPVEYPNFVEFPLLVCGAGRLLDGRNLEGERILYYILFPFPSTIRVRLAYDVRYLVYASFSQLFVSFRETLGRGRSVLFVRSLSYTFVWKHLYAWICVVCLKL